ncbi:hypothetical protein ACLK2H_00160 [Escherichia coli]
MAKDLLDGVMARIGATDYTVLGTVKGADLELMRFTHPFMGFDVPAILGDHVTLDAGTGAVHTAGGKMPYDYVISQKYGLEIANPVGPDGAYLAGTYPELDGVNVFKANDKIVPLLTKKVRCCTLRKCCTAIRAAGVTKRQSSSVRRRSGLSAWIRKACVFSRSKYLPYRAGWSDERKSERLDPCMG